MRQRAREHAGRLDAAVGQVDASAGLGQPVVTLEAVAGGLGVAIARRTLVSADRSGRLVRVLAGEIATSWSHYAVTLPERAGEPTIRAFVAWLSGGGHEPRLALSLTAESPADRQQRGAPP